ncbi:MAG: hypothetical protein LC792_10180 [Actinobacteria bacterium]|nr:hypothetical protein [Actinomycetota bacterium]
MSASVAALATVIAVFVMLRAERKDLAKASDLVRVEARIETLETKLTTRIEALESKMTARLDTVVLELGKAFGRPTN